MSKYVLIVVGFIMFILSLYLWYIDKGTWFLLLAISLTIIGIEVVDFVAHN